MATTFSTQIASRSPFHAPPATITHAAPAGTFLPGTKVQVGNHRVIVEKYLSEGGFAHVYVVRLPKPVDGDDKAVLKRVAVPGKELLANMRTEVETMKRLRGQKYIVKYIDSHASQLKAGGYEVFLLMEYCSGGGLIDFMNTRLQQRLTEPEILKVFTDVAEGVASMHYLKPPLLHRDIKVENVLISGAGASKKFKVCDFGSAAPPRPAASSAAEGRLIEDDVQRHTTLQYRSPEMIDVYRKQPIDEKSDIWALGVFLYKLCYYTTPFEEKGQMAILNASFKYPAYPQFSDNLKLLIATMLRENPAKRPNIYQVLQQACKMQAKEVPIKDIYVQRSQSESRQHQHLPNPESSQSRAGATLSPPSKEQPRNVPDVAPMRRGRPDKPVSHHASAKPSPSPLRMMDANDPFASLDGGKTAGGDELSSRFPTLDQFSLLTEPGRKFEFDPATVNAEDGKTEDLSVRVTHALADEAFLRSPSPPKTKSKPISEHAASVNRSRTGIEDRNSMDARAGASPVASKPTPVAKIPATATVGSMTMNPPRASSMTQALNRTIRRFPSPSSVSQETQAQRRQDSSLRNTAGPLSESRLANLLKHDASRSQEIPDYEPRSPTSSRPSLEGGRPSLKDLDADLGLSRSRSLNLRPRPKSVNIGHTMSHAKDRNLTPRDLETSEEPEMLPLRAVDSETTITSDVDFLKAKEEEDRRRHKHHKRLSSGSKHIKRASLPSISLPGTKNLLNGRFGDVFRKFESNHNHTEPDGSRSRSPSLSREPLNSLTPIAGSEATDLSDDRHAWDETEDLSPEMRRELEKHRLEAEERRVAAAAADYRRRIAEKGGGREAGRAMVIQNKVQSLLKENEKPATRIAEGYGRFTDSASSPQARRFEAPTKPPAVVPGIPHAATEPSMSAKPFSAPSSTTNVAVVDKPLPLRPAAPPKPHMLRTGGTRPEAAPVGGPQTVADAIGLPDDWEAQFNKKYPNLSGLDMVEREIEIQKPEARVRTKEI